MNSNNQNQKRNNSSELFKVLEAKNKKNSKSSKVLNFIKIDSTIMDSAIKIQDEKTIRHLSYKITQQFLKLILPEK